MKNEKFVYQPNVYARDAIQILEDQLRRVKSPHKRKKIEKRIEDWHKRLEVFKKIDEKANG